MIIWWVKSCLITDYFSYKKPKGIPHKFDAKKQAEFIEHYEELKSALNDCEPLLFMDAVHPIQAMKFGAWATRGEKPKERTQLLLVIFGFVLGILFQTIYNIFDVYRASGQSKIKCLTGIN